jgi:SAM-dependent methyltransferase
MIFNWDTIQYRNDGKVYLLWRHERLFKEYVIKRYQHVLDVGSWGHLPERIHQEFSQCWVMDNLSTDCYYKERVQGYGPYFIHDDICKLSQETELKYANHFDVITCFETLEHVESQEQAVRNIHKLLSWNGVFAGTVPIPGFSHAENEPGIKFLDTEQLANLLSLCGFSQIFIEPTGSVNSSDTPCSLYFRCRKG